MKTLLAIFAAAHALFFAVLAYRATYTLGYRTGFSAGRKKEADWWMSSDQEVSQCRQRIWMEDD